MKTTRSSSSQQKRLQDYTVSSSKHVSTESDTHSANQAEHCGDLTEAAHLEQRLGFDMPVVMQRQAPMVQTVLGGSAVAVHREGHRNFCPDAGEDPSGSNDARIHCCNTLVVRYRKRSSWRCDAREVLVIQKCRRPQSSHWSSAH